MTAPDHFAALADHILPGARLRSARPLTGGVSADIHALELEGSDGRCRTVVVRQHRSAEWKPRHDQVAATEYELLGVLYRNGLPVPRPLLLDTIGSLLPEPFLVMEFIEGSTNVPADALDPCLEAMADTLCQLHDLSTDDLPAMPSRLDPLPEQFDYLPQGPEWQELSTHLASRTDSAYGAQPVLLHGDFWPGNLLWREGHLVAILDWEDAALGDPASDVAGCRLELLWKYGPAAREHFTAAYAHKRPIDARRLALWEVFVGSAAAHFMGAWGLEPGREAEMRRQAYDVVREAGRALQTFGSLA